MDISKYMCTLEEYENWKNGLLLFAGYRGEDSENCLDTYENIVKELQEKNPGIDLNDVDERQALFEELEVATYKEFFDNFENAYEKTRTKNGNCVVCFGFSW